MAGADVYRARFWHELVQQQERWLGNGPAIMVIPEEEDKREVARLFPGLGRESIVSIPELVERYVVKCLGQKGLVNRHGMESILSSIMGEGFVPYLNIEKYRQSYIKVLTDFVFNFRRSSILDFKTALEQFREGEERFNSRETDLARLYLEYENRLSDYGYDFKKGLEHFAGHSGKEDPCGQLGLEKGQRIIFFGFNHITPLEGEFIFSLFHVGNKVVFLVAADPGAAEQSVRIQKSIAALLRRSRDILKLHDLITPGTSSFFEDLSQAIFQPGSAPGSKPDRGRELSSQGKVIVSRENNRFSEVVTIARRIKQLQQDGVSLSSIRIVPSESHLYGTIIREVLPEYGIPFVLERGMPLLAYPLASVIHCLVNQSVISNPFSLREKIFSSPYICFEKIVSAADLLRYQEKNGVEFIAKKDLDDELSGHIASPHSLDYTHVKQLRLHAYRVVKPASGTPMLEVVRQYLSNLKIKNNTDKQGRMARSLIQFYLLDQAEKALAAWPSRLDAATFKEGLLDLIRRFKVEENIAFTAGEAIPRTLLTKIQARDLEILKKTEGLLDEFIACLAPMGKGGAGETRQQYTANKYSRHELVRIFSRMLDEAHLPVVSGEGARVLVHPVNDGCYRQYDYTFVCGLVDGEFPRKDDFNFLQPKKEGLGITSPYSSIDHARNYFYRLLCSTVKTFQVSLPSSHNGRKLPASPFVAELEKCLPPATGTQPAEGDNNRVIGDSVEPAAQEKLYSRREKLLSLGRNVDNCYDQALPLLEEFLETDEPLYKHLVALLRFDGMSLNARYFSEYDGVFSRADGSRALLSRILEQLIFTPAHLERYAACPFRFFLDDIMSMKKEPDFHPDTAEKGAIIRSVLKAYTEQAVLEKGVPTAAAALLQGLIMEHYRDRELELKDAFEARFLKQLPAGLEEPRVKRPGLFAAFLDREKDGPDLLKPYLANLCGKVCLGDGLELNVEIDRVDCTPDGETMLAYIYSTADVGDTQKIKKGLAFALPLALILLLDYASEKELAAAVGGGAIYLVKSPKHIRRGGYFALKSIRAARRESVSSEKPVFSGQHHGFMDEEQFSESLEKIKQHVEKLYGLMNNGVFHLPLSQERDHSCGNCSFGRVCRKEQLRLDRLAINLRGSKNIHMVKEIF